MDIDFDDVEELADYVTVPAGTYLCKVAEVRPGTTRKGDDRWAVRLVVSEGEFAGRHAAWDGLVFSARGRARVKQVFTALGLPNEGRVSIGPEDIAGREAFVQIRPVEFTSPSTGQTIKRNEVPYQGYTSIAQSSAGRQDAPREEPDMPF